MTAAGSKLRTLTREELLERLAAVPADAEPTAVAEVSAGRWALRHAAVLRGFFTLSELVAGSRPAPEPDDEMSFIREDCEPARTLHGSRWRLRAEARTASMDHLEHRRDLLLATLDGAPADTLDVGRTMAEAYLRNAAPPLAEQNLGQLSGTRVASQWLGGIIAGLPRPAEVEAQIRLTSLFAPLRMILDTPLRGREAEMDQMRRYLGRRAEPSEGFRPLVVSGPGGMGKSTLLASVLLERSGRGSTEPTAVFTYLTFDRMDLAPQKPLAVLAEILGQIAIQVPAGARRCTGVARQLEQTQEAISAQERDTSRHRGTTDVWRRWLRDIDVLVRDFAEATTATTGGDLVCILDTFERAQRHGSTPVDRLWEVLSQVAQVLPGLRVIVAGRGGVPDHDVVRLELRGLGHAAARSVLTDRLGDPRAVPKSLLDTVVRRARGPP